MFKQNQLKYLILLFLIYCHLTNAETKVLKQFSVALKNTLRDDTISLDDDGHLKTEGFVVQKFPIPNDPNHILKLILEFVADKNGYRPKYKLVREEYEEPHRLTPNTLKSLSG